MSILSLDWLEDESPRDLARWAVAAAIVLGIHAGAVAYFIVVHQPVEIGGDVDAVTVELAPIDSTPDAAASDAAPAPETMIESKPVPEPEKERPREELKVEQPPPDEAQALIPAPAVKPPEQIEEARPPAPLTAQRVRGGAPRVEPSWQSSLVHQLQRAKRYPSEAQARGEQGIVVLSLSLDRNGHVLARKVTRSSGFVDLDKEVLAMIARAEPLPPFPESMPQPRLDVTVPIRFSLR
jgi:periplasmic protein TonB